MALGNPVEGVLSPQACAANAIELRVPVAVERMRDRVHDLVAGHTSFGSIAAIVIPEDAQRNLRIAARIVSLAIAQILGAEAHVAIATVYWAHGATRGQAAGGFKLGGDSVRKALASQDKFLWSPEEMMRLEALALTVLHVGGNHDGQPDFASIAMILNAEFHGGQKVRGREGAGKRYRSLNAPALPPAAASQEGPK